MPNINASQAALDYMQQEPDAGMREQCQALLRAAQNGDAPAISDLQDRFGRHLAFGTAGMRGKMEAGFTRLNRVTVAKVAFAIGQWLKPEAGPVVVGFDARLNSSDFADEVAAVLCGLGYRVFAFDSYVATPICAFAVKELMAQAGVMITASHNPPQDNGVKVYGASGAQIIESDAQTIEKHLASAPAYGDLKRLNAKEQVPTVVLDSYFDKLQKARISPEAKRADLRIVYTPMHGVGARFVERAFKHLDFVELLPVAAQREPDGGFPTVLFPNPEEDGALDLAISEAERLKADLVLANDPDVDRLAVALLKNGHYQMLTGNELGAILGCDVLENMASEKVKLVVSTLASSRLLCAMAKANKASYAESLTGFSRVCQIARDREKEHGERFVFGFEEALGYCYGDIVRDKDGIGSAVRLVERAAMLKAQGRTLWDELDRIALKYGLFRNTQWSFRFFGTSGLQQQEKIMHSLRELKAGAPFLGGPIIDHTHDLLSENYQNFAKSNILIFKLKDGTRIIVRPSGTEPKLKFYVEKTVDVPNGDALDAERSRLDADLLQIKKRVSAAFAHPR